jgi:uncharacterized protein YndB with AHSA1/START domain
VPRIDTEITIDRPPAEVWAVLGDLTNLEWVPGIDSARMEGTRRICMLQDGGEIHDEISNFSDESRSYSYTQPVHPLGFERSVGTVAVQSADGGSRVVWEAEFSCADPQQEAQVEPMLREGYGAAMQRLKAVVESQ